jgi:hypothetical protein
MLMRFCAAVLYCRFVLRFNHSVCFIRPNFVKITESESPRCFGNSSISALKAIAGVNSFALLQRYGASMR